MPRAGGCELPSGGISTDLHTSSFSAASHWSMVMHAPPPRLLALGTASVVVAAVRSPWSVACGISLGVLMMAAAVDARELRLPDQLVALAALPLLVASTVALAVGRPEIVTGMLAGAAVAGLPVAVLHLVNPAAMGFGDVKTSLVLGAAMGLVEWRLALVTLGVAAGAAAATCTIRRRPSIAFGPFLVVGAVAVLLIASLAAVLTSSPTLWPTAGEVFPWR